MTDEAANNALPGEIQHGATLSGNEYGWSIEAFPESLRQAETLGYACLGGQFQFYLPDATYEMYWLNSDSTERHSGESWIDYCQRSCAEVRSGFERLVAHTDFYAQASEWLSLKSKISEGYDPLRNLIFVAYFVTESQLASLREAR
jgi:hypothetical protein